jgi:hypothetical protein
MAQIENWRIRVMKCVYGTSVAASLPFCSSLMRLKIWFVMRMPGLFKIPHVCFKMINLVRGGTV